ncbi:hypothetical protein [Thalassovita taeanensis]|nr:hypothetical protein [Thalassovita taeanensis]
MLTEPTNPLLAQSCAHLLALHTALECPADPETPEDAAKAELIRLIAFQPAMLADAVCLSTKILADRDFTFGGTHPGVIFAVESLADFYGADLDTTRSAIRLCGGMPFHESGRTIHADDEHASFMLDAAAIEAANKKAKG